MKDFFLEMFEDFVAVPLHFVFLGKLGDDRLITLLVWIASLFVVGGALSAAFYAPFAGWAHLVECIQAAPWAYRPGALAEASARLAEARENLAVVSYVYAALIAPCALAIARDALIGLDRVITRAVRRVYPEF